MKLRRSAPPTEQELAGCRLLLLEIVKRAIYDWVLFRMDDDPAQRGVAVEAYTWLFDEGPGHPIWEEEKKSGTHVTSFVYICEVLSLDPSFLRKCASRLTASDILNAGRPPDRRRPRRDKGGIDESFIRGLIDSYKADYAPIEEPGLISDGHALRRAADVP